jgi:poly-gamma-glutamate capsule biosynthesis protein CapA/YwtB (metallophosphatase superfamily)
MVLTAVAVRAVMREEGPASSIPPPGPGGRSPAGAGPVTRDPSTPATERAAPGTTIRPSAPGEPAPPARGTLLIHGTGDVNLDASYIPAFREHGYEWAWSGLEGLFLRDDLTVVNLECAVSELGTPQPKDFTFRASPAALPPARSAGVEVANLGNNHSRDFGVEALLDTRAHLDANGIAPVGAGKDLAEATRPALFELNGWTVAVLGFGGVYPTLDWFAGPDHPGMASGDDIPTMVEAVRSAGRVADIVVVAIHWGVELDLQPRPEDVERAHAMIDAGADVIFGHHSHRLNPMAVYRGRPIFWSLGNFVWPSFSAAGSATAVAEVTVTPDERYRGRLIPASIRSSGHPVLTGP